MNGIIIYKGKYGATRQYAEWISEELKIPALQPGHWGDQDLRECDYVILGSSVYIGKLQIGEWVKQHRSALLGKSIFLFVVSGTPLSETAKLKGYVLDSLPKEIVNNCHIYYLPGRLIYKKLSLMDKFMLRMGALLQREPERRKAMLTDYDDVKREYIQPLFNKLLHFEQQEL